MKGFIQFLTEIPSHRKGMGNEIVARNKVFTKFGNGVQIGNKVLSLISIPRTSFFWQDGKSDLNCSGGNPCHLLLNYVLLAQLSFLAYYRQARRLFSHKAPCEYISKEIVCPRDLENHAQNSKKEFPHMIFITGKSTWRKYRITWSCWIRGLQKVCPVFWH